MPNISQAWALQIEQRWRKFVPTLSNVTKLWHDTHGSLFDWSENTIQLTAREPVKMLLELHWCNYQIWHYEDICRSKDDARIVAAKRSIDKLNQRRNDLIEHIDECFISEQGVTGDYTSETLASILDRISVTVLKIYHMTEIIHGHHIDTDLRVILDAKFAILVEQMEFLTQQADILYCHMKNGVRRMRVFRQLKMYNNAATNPQMEQ